MQLALPHCSLLLRLVLHSELVVTVAVALSPQLVLRHRELLLLLNLGAKLVVAALSLLFGTRVVLSRDHCCVLLGRDLARAARRGVQPPSLGDA
eukprot:564892-Prymnesium_polylepis.1